MPKNMLAQLKILNFPDWVTMPQVRMLDFVINQIVAQPVENKMDITINGLHSQFSQSVF